MCMKSNVRWNPMRNSQKCSLPSVSLYIFPRHLREPVVEGSKEREQNSAHDDVVKVSDHEIRIAELPVEGRDAQHDSRSGRRSGTETEMRCRTASAS